MSQVFQGRWDPPEPEGTHKQSIEGKRVLLGGTRRPRDPSGPERGRCQSLGMGRLTGLGFWWGSVDDSESPTF